jgi:hypothetical protein
MVTVLVGPGQYNATSCGAVAVRPLNVTGSGGSSVTTFDCGLTDRLLATNDSVVVVGLTVTRGFASLFVDDTDDVYTDVAGVGGGGAVAVVWPLVLPGARAVLGDLVVTHSVVVGVVNGTGTAAVYVGGGGLLVFGGGSGAVVEVSGCRFVNTSVVVSNPAKEGAAQVYGGAVFVGLVTAVDLVGGSVSVRDVAYTGTSISCDMCQRTWHATVYGCAHRA